MRQIERQMRSQLDSAAQAYTRLQREVEAANRRLSVSRKQAGHLEAEAKALRSPVSVC
jgi:hypothetical protein